MTVNTAAEALHRAPPRPLPASRSAARSAAVAALLGTVCIGGCSSKKAFSEPQRLGGQTIAAQTLNQGKKIFGRYCIACHGEAGDGKVPSAASMKPPPRDFTAGIFKFTSVPAGELPTDADLMRTVRRGLGGTHMAAWASLPREDLQAVVHYVKTFSPRWRTEKPGTPIRVGDDPWADGRRGEARQRGRAVYHAAAACWQCHPAYARQDEIAAMRRQLEAEAKKLHLEPLPERDEPLAAAPVDTVFGRLLPPDFLKEEPKTGKQKAALLRAIAAGIGGTPMPSWAGKLPAAELWAVVHYVRELLRIRDTPRAESLRKSWQTTSSSPKAARPPGPAQN